MKEYTILAKETTSGIFYIRGNSKEEALNKFDEMLLDGGYRDMMETVEDFTSEVVSYQVVDGTEIEPVYSPEADITFLMKYTYRNGEVIAEEVIGFYHGEPNDKDTEEYSAKGTSAILI